MKQFWESYYDFTDRNDFPTARFGSTSVQPNRTNGGTLAFGDVNQAGTTLADLGTLLGTVTDTASDPDAPGDGSRLANGEPLRPRDGAEALLLRPTRRLAPSRIPSSAASSKRSRTRSTTTRRSFAS